MTTFNRCSTYALAAILLSAGLLLVAFAIYLPGPYVVTALDGEQFSFSPLSAADKLATIGGGLALTLAGVFGLALELLGPPRRQHLPVAAHGRAQVTVARASVEARLVGLLERLPDVTQARVQLRQEHKALGLDVQLLLAAGASAATLGEQAQTLVERAYADEFGLALGHVTWRVRYAPAGAEPVGAPAFGGPRD